MRLSGIFAAALATLTFGPLVTSQNQPDPWAAAAVLQPADFARSLESGSPPPVIIAAAFPVLYNSKHIKGAIFAGPGSSPEGIEALKKAVAKVAKDREIVLYCGCCPMEKCPNLRPAFKALRELGFTRVKVLSIPTNMATDWYAKNYPSEDGSILQTK